MNIAELLTIARIKLADPIHDNSANPNASDDEDSLFKTDELIYYINNAVREACVRGHMLTERDIVFKIKENVAQYNTPDNLIKLTQVIDENDEPLSKVQEVDLDRGGYKVAWNSEIPVATNSWRNDVRDIPTYFIQDQPNHIRFYPIPTKYQTLRIKGIFYPDLMSESDELPDELNVLYHHNLLDWVLYECFSKVDADSYDSSRGYDNLNSFNEVFGEKPSALQIREIQNYPDQAGSLPDY